jgi:hypothetical protein
MLSSEAAPVKIFSRRKVGESSHQCPRGRRRCPLEFNLETISAMSNMPQAHAALKLGVSVTSMKQICRRLGIDRWPYTRKGRQFSRAAMRSPSSGRLESESNDSAETESEEWYKSASWNAKTTLTVEEPSYTAHVHGCSSSSSDSLPSAYVRHGPMPESTMPLHKIVSEVVQAFSSAVPQYGGHILDSEDDCSDDLSYLISFV